MELIYVVKGHIDELEKADIVSTSKMVPVFIKHTLLNKSHVIHFIIEMVVTDRFHCINGNCCQHSYDYIHDTCYAEDDFEKHVINKVNFGSVIAISWPHFRWDPSTVAEGCP